jgi:hypothetical protein
MTTFTLRRGELSGRSASNGSAPTGVGFAAKSVNAAGGALAVVAPLRCQNAAAASRAVVVVGVTALVGGTGSLAIRLISSSTSTPAAFKSACAPSMSVVFKPDAPRRCRSACPGGGRAIAIALSPPGRKRPRRRGRPRRTARPARLEAERIDGEVDRPLLVGDRVTRGRSAGCELQSDSRLPVGVGVRPKRAWMGAAREPIAGGNRVAFGSGIGCSPDVRGGAPI